FAAGEGTFTATGLIGLPRKDGSAHASSRIEWQADSLRVLNRPDRRLVLDGEGTLTYEGQRLAVRGKISVDQGNFEYRSEEDTPLASDIVVVGSPRPGGAREPAAADDGAASPFDVDLAIDLGRD